MKNGNAILGVLWRRIRVWVTRVWESVMPVSWRVDSMVWYGLWCWIRIWEIKSASGDGSSDGFGSEIDECDDDEEQSGRIRIWIWIWEKMDVMREWVSRRAMAGMFKEERKLGFIC